MGSKDMSPDVPFAELIRRVQDGDAVAARVVFDAYSHRLVRLAAAHLPLVLTPKLDPEDVVQSVFRSFFTRHQEGRFTLANWDSLWSLLTMLTVRKCGHRVEHFRAARRDVRRETAQGEATPSSGPDWETADPAPSPAEAILLAETLAALLQQLPTAQRRIVQMRLEGYTIEEISQHIRCTERTVYRNLEKARASLELSLADSAAS
jgi:RNA polymerase sigma-70 factor, ECF subfamily